MGRARRAGESTGIRDGLIYDALRSKSLERFAQVIVHYVRDCLPPVRRSPSALRALRKDLSDALERLFYTSVPIDVVTTPPALEHLASDDVPGADAAVLEVLHSAANLLDHARDATADGTLLREAAPSLIEVARVHAEKRLCDMTVSVVRDSEGMGAPPTVVYLSNAQIMWINGSFERMMESRKLDRAVVLGHTTEFAARICLDLHNGNEGFDLEERVPDPRLFMEAGVENRGSLGESIVSVRVAQVRRKPVLSNRELEVVRLLSDLKGYQAVADELKISLDSVRTHVRRAYRKLGVSDRVTLKARLQRENLI